GITKRFAPIPRQKNIAKWFDAKDKAKVELTKPEADLINFMQGEWIKARDYLIKIEAMNKGMNADNYYAHIRRGVLEATIEDGPIQAAKEIFRAYQLDEMTFNILDSQTGAIMALDKFFRFAMQRTGVLAPTQNIVKSFLAYMKTFKKKQALDEIVPLIDIYAHSLTPKGMTKTGVLLHGNLIQFTKEWLNTQKGRKITLLAKQGGKIDLALRGMRNFTSLLDLGGNIPVMVATQIGEQVITYKLLGKWKYATSKIKSLTPRGRRIRKKYTAFIGKNPWIELFEPTKGIATRFNEGIFLLFKDANVRRTRNFLLGSLTKQEWKSEIISPERLASLRTELGRYGVVPGAKSIYGATSAGGAWTQYKTWALPILRSELQNINNLIKSPALISKTYRAKNKVKTQKALLDLYRTLELVVIVSVIRSLMGDEEDESMLNKIKSRAYLELSTIWQALDPKLFMAAGRIVSFLEDLGHNISTIIKLETYQQSRFGEYKAGELKGLNKLIKQLTPRAIKQFEKEKIKTP
ncbi:hypothetical protein KAU19_08440, partial [Candidatus Parcubacteria bacterium]|nr:hypothetical protein [Candidatus Parcubacteria bacterium]